MATTDCKRKMYVASGSSKVKGAPMVDCSHHRWICHPWTGFASNLSNHYWVLAATPFFCEQIHQEMAVSNNHLQQEKPIGNLLPTSL